MDQARRGHLLAMMPRGPRRYTRMESNIRLSPLTTERTKMRRLLHVWFAAFVVGAGSSCAGLERIGAQETSVLSEHQRRSLEALVCHFSELPRPTGYTSGSAIVLGGNRLLTVQHVLPETAQGIAFEMDGEFVAGVP